jgi:hypothetical protein
MFAPSAGQMAGQLGQVMRLGDPAEGPEFVLVRFGKDELGFSPADLMIPPKRMPAPRSPQPAAKLEPVLAGPPLLAEPSKRKIKTMETVAVEKVVAPRKPAKAKAVAELTVTLTCQDGQWSVQAARGAKVVAKSVPVRAPDAVAMVALLNAPAVQDAVDELVSVARAAAQEEAQRLRDQLAEVEARLAELPAS